MDEKDLDNLPRKNIFKVPDGYFEELPGHIQNLTIPPSKIETTTKIFKIKFLKPVLTFVLIFGFVFFYYQKNNNKESSSLSFSDTVNGNKEYNNTIASNNVGISDLNKNYSSSNKSYQEGSQDPLNNIAIQDILIYIDGQELEEIYSEE